MNFTDEIQDILNRKQNPGTQNTDEETREAVRQLAEHNKRKEEEIYTALDALTQQVQQLTQQQRQPSQTKEQDLQKEKLRDEIKKLREDLDKEREGTLEVVEWLSEQIDDTELRISRNEKKVAETQEEIETCIDYIEQETCENHDRIEELEQRIEHLEKAVTKNGEKQTVETEQEQSDTLSPNHYTMEERVEEVKKLLRNNEEGLTRAEIAKKLFNRDKYGNADDPHQVRIEAVLSKLRKQDRLETNGKTTLEGSGYERKRYALKQEDKTETKQEEEEEELQPSDIKGISKDQSLEPDYWSVEQREKIIRKALENSSEPLSKQELAETLYNIDHDVKTGGTYHNRLQAPIRKLKNKDVVEAKGTKKLRSYEEDELKPSNKHSTREVKAYGLKQKDYSQQETETETEAEEEDNNLSPYNLAKEREGLTEHDMKLVHNAFRKALKETQKYPEDEREISYHLFEQHYEGDKKPLNMIQKLFTNPALLGKVNEETAPDKEFKWVKKAGKQYSSGVRSWVIKVE